MAANPVVRPGGKRAHTETTVLGQVKKSQQNRAPAFEGRQITAKRFVGPRNLPSQLMGCSDLCRLDPINLNISNERAQGHFLSPWSKSGAFYTKEPLTGAGAGPRGHCRLAACPGDRILRSQIRIRSRILGSNHFAFPSLAAVASGQVSGSVRFLSASPFGAPTTSASTARHLPHLTGRSSSSRTTTSIVATAAPLAASTHVSHAPRVRQ